MRAKAIVWRAGFLILIMGLGITAVLILAYAKNLSEPAVQGGGPTARLINTRQYVNTVHYLFGEDIQVRSSFPPLQRKQGLVSLGAATAAMTPGALEQFDRAARSIAMQIVDEAHRQTLVPCTPRAVNAPDAACAAEFFAKLGRFLYRRPLTEAELDAYVAMAGEATETVGDFYAGIASSLAGMMTSPKFLYIIEDIEPDPERAGQYRLDAYSKASRLSLFLWNALPDEGLLAVAATGEIHDDKELARQIERMLTSARLEHGVRSFFSDMLHFEEFDTLSKDSVIYPVFTRTVVRAAEEQTLRLIVDHLLTRQADYRDLFTSHRTFVNRALGSLYNVPVERRHGWIPHELDSDQSAGLVTSLSFSALHSHPGRSSPTLRGKAVREIFLCQTIPEPPPNVDFSMFEDSSGLKTARERLDAHNVDPVCAGCHKLTDPIGLALENFDGAGQFRARENGDLIDASGEFDGRRFTDVAAFGEALRDHPALAPCLASRLYAYGVGREVDRADRPWLAWIRNRFAAYEYRLPHLLREIAESEAFYAVAVSSDYNGVRRASR